MRELIKNRKYDTENADLVASEYYPDASIWDQRERNTYLYKTKWGAFFLHRTTQRKGEKESLEVISVAHAKTVYYILPKHEMGYKDAFGEEPEEA